MSKEQILQEINKIDQQLLTVNYLQKAIMAYEAFLYRFTNKDNQKFSGFRNHYGSMIAFGMSLHNTYHLKQTILKQCIYLTKSKNPNIIKLTIIPMTGFYFGVLFSLWHIPSMSGELALRTYAGVQSAVLTLLLDQEELFKEIPLKSIIN